MSKSMVSYSLNGNATAVCPTCHKAIDVVVRMNVGIQHCPCGTEVAVYATAKATKWPTSQPTDDAPSTSHTTAAAPRQRSKAWP